MSMSPIFKLWIDRCGRIPPRHFWSTLILFMHYAWLQAVHAAKRERPGGSLESHINLKRTHYLEKTMLCGSDRTEELDFIYRNLKAYVESPAGPEDDCYLYMVKMLQEYECYPDKFNCYMHGVSSKPYSEIEPKVLRRIIVQRRSIRRFQDRTIEDDKLKQIAESASFAPTSCNAQPLIVITLTKPEIVHRVFQGARGAEEWAKSVPSGIVIAADRRHYKPFDQHIVMFQDIASALQNCLLTCEALNLAACWVSLISDVHMNNQEDLHRLLGLPDYYVVGGAIAVGYPANMVCHVPRRPLSRVWHKELFVESASSHAERR
jgi:nitroreductase